ncbi:MAG: S8 family serine peptidase [Pseudomonadota bacterium]
MPSPLARLAFGFVMCVALAGTAAAQLPVPQVQLPQLPAPGGTLPGVQDLGRGVGGTLRDLSAARALRVERAYREHRAELDRVNDELIVRAEVVAIDITDPALAQALKADFVVLRTQELADLGLRITVLQTPAGWSASRGLKRLRKLDPPGTYDYNHVYLDSGGIGTAVAGLAAPESAAGSGGARLGLIDGGVDDSHRVFSGVRLHRFGCNGVAVPSAHGTAVASLAVRGQSMGDLYAADVYCGAPAGGAIDAVAAAFGWMAREHVAVINVSLVGPRNVLLERVVRSLIDQGYTIVAAVGNDGPAAPPLFPASYDGVVGVTAVDAKDRVLVEAGRGKQVDFAAPGLDQNAAATAPDSYAPVRGTSFAAPLVAGLLAQRIAAPDAQRHQRALDELTRSAQDLGARGRDDIYGAGLVGTYK